MFKLTSSLFTSKHLIQLHVADPMPSLQIELCSKFNMGRDIEIINTHAIIITTNDDLVKL